MRNFEDALELEWIDGHNWKVAADFYYTTDVHLSGSPSNRIVVPKGFVTDFASIPRPLWNVLPPTGAYGKAAVLHDYLYRTAGMATRPEADAVLKEAMEVIGVGWWTRQIIWLGVRAGGSSSYRGGL